MAAEGDPRLARALERYEGFGGETRPAPLGRGLINETYLVSDADGARYVLQRVNPIFDPRIHVNIAAVTTRLAGAGLLTPRLVAARDGALWVDLDGDGRGVYRLMTFVDGATFDTVESPAQARSAGRLVGRFHRALEGLAHEFVGARVGVHDTPRHLARLRDALGRCAGHRLGAAVRPLGEELLGLARALPPLPPLADRPCHGDLKLNNVRFAGTTPPASHDALCLIDLDTVGPMPLSHELGDAWRSWCNDAGEDALEGRFDLEVFEASLGGYLEGRGRALSADEARALLHGVEWISLELAARFAADAVEERYFGWDRARYPAAGEHNLVRARGQLALHRAVVDTRRDREALLAATPD
jgi:Ser/Thr protein kinase RdoA (MazF antagonist)